MKFTENKVNEIQEALHSKKVANPIAGNIIGIGIGIDMKATYFIEHKGTIVSKNSDVFDHIHVLDVLNREIPEFLRECKLFVRRGDDIYAESLSMYEIY